METVVSEEKTEVVDPTKLVDDEVSRVLAVSDSDNESVHSIPEKKVKKHTRPFMIRQLKEILAANGFSSDEIRDMKLTRRRKQSLANILEAEVGKRIQRGVEEKLGIPQDADGRTKYAVNMLYRADLSLCKLVEKGINLSPLPFECGDIASEIDNSPMSDEVKQCFEEWLLDPENNWIQEYCGPGSRLILVHLYAVMNSLKPRGLNHTPYRNERLQNIAREAAVRTVLRQPPVSLNKIPTPRVKTVTKIPKVTTSTVRVV